MGSLGGTQYPSQSNACQFEILGFDMFVDDSGLRMSFTPSGAIDEDATGLVPEVRELFERETAIDLRKLFNKNRAGSLQSIRSFGQYSARVMREFMQARPDLEETLFGAALKAMNASETTIARYSNY